MIDTIDNEIIKESKNREFTKMELDEIYKKAREGVKPQTIAKLYGLSSEEFIELVEEDIEYNKAVGEFEEKVQRLFYDSLFKTTKVSDKLLMLALSYYLNISSDSDDGSSDLAPVLNFGGLEEIESND